MFFTKNLKLFFQFPFCSVCFRCTVTKLNFELLKLNIKLCFHVYIWYSFTWLTVDMCCLSYWSLSKPYFWSLPVLLGFTLVLSASTKDRSKTLLLHFVKTENWRDATSSCHMGCLQWSALCVSVLLYFKKSEILLVKNLYTFCVHFTFMYVGLFLSCSVMNYWTHDPYGCCIKNWHRT